MAKRKKRTSSEKKATTFKIDLTGLILILIAIIGLGKFGIVGDFIRSFAAFLVGNLYAVLLLALFIVGIYIIFKKTTPNFFSGKLVGLYIMTFALLVLAHLYGGYYNDFQTTGFWKDLGAI